MKRASSFLLLFISILSAFSQPKDNSASVKVLTEKVVVLPVNINSEFAEHSPFLSKNNLYFISNRNNKLGLSYTSNNQNTSDIYICKQLDSVSFTKPMVVSNLNTIYDDGPVMLSNKESIAVYSAGSKKGNLQIYYSILQDGAWSKPLLHPVSRGNDSYCHPQLSTNGKVLIFCSDKAGGFGGMDIYYSKLDGLTWSNPINLGAKVNSAANEVFPNLSKDGNLYFSSTRDVGLGGLDLYSFNLNDSSNATVLHLDSPLNSAADDFSICFDSTLRSGYFSSNRLKTGNDNIFYFMHPVPVFKKCMPMKKSSCFTFLKENYSLPEDAKESEYEWEFGDGNKIRARAVKHCYSQPGLYTVKLNVVDKVSGKMIYNEMAYTIAVKPQGLHIEVKDTLYLDEPVQLDASESQLDGYKILSYTWLFNDTSFSKGAKASHRYKQNGIYLVELGVEAQNIITKEIKNFCVDKWILVGDKIFIEKNLRHFKYAELLPDADSLYFQEEEDVALNMSKKEKTFRFSKLKEDAFALTGEEDGDIVLNEKERKLRTHKFGLLATDNTSLDEMGDEEAMLRAKQRLLRLKNASLPPIVDTLYLPKEGQETIYKVNLGWSDKQVDKQSGVFEGIKKLEETQEGKRYRYTSGSEKQFADIVPYYEEAQKKGFKDAAVVGFDNNQMSKGQVKNLSGILFDSASVENQAVKVYFKYDVATYDMKYNRRLDSLLLKSVNIQQQKILLITHFDGLGSESYNLTLNKSRANNMIKYLVKKGVQPAQIKTEFILHPTEKLEPDLLRRIEVFLMN